MDRNPNRMSVHRKVRHGTITSLWLFQRVDEGGEIVRGVLKEERFCLVKNAMCIAYFVCRLHAVKRAGFDELYSTPIALYFFIHFTTNNLLRTATEVRDPRALVIKTGGSLICHWSMEEPMLMFHLTAMGASPLESHRHFNVTSTLAFKFSGRVLFDLRNVSN